MRAVGKVDFEFVKICLLKRSWGKFGMAAPLRDSGGYSYSAPTSIYIGTSRDVETWEMQPQVLPPTELPSLPRYGILYACFSLARPGNVMLNLALRILHRA